MAKCHRAWCGSGRPNFSPMVQARYHRAPTDDRSAAPSVRNACRAHRSGSSRAPRRAPARAAARIARPRRPSRRAPRDARARRRPARGHRRADRRHATADEHFSPRDTGFVQRADRHVAHAARLGLRREPQRLRRMVFEIGRGHPAERRRQQGFPSSRRLSCCSATAASSWPRSNASSTSRDAATRISSTSPGSASLMRRSSIGRSAPTA